MKMFSISPLWIGVARLTGLVWLSSTALLSGCQQPGAVTKTTAGAQVSASSGVLATPLQFAGQPVAASAFAVIGLAGQQIGFSARDKQLWLHQGGRTEALLSGAFARLKLQPETAGTALLAAVEQNSNQLYLWRLTAGAPVRLELLSQTRLTRRVAEDLCFYHSEQNQQLSIFVIGDRGGADQLLLRQQQQWLPAPLPIRELGIGYDSKACAVDARRGLLYIGEADRALWRYQAEPEADESRQLMQVQQPFGALAGEITGLDVLPDGSLLVLEAEPARVLRLGPVAKADTSIEQRFELLQHFDLSDDKPETFAWTPPGTALKEAQALVWWPTAGHSTTLSYQLAVLSEPQSAVQLSGAALAVRSPSEPAAQRPFAQLQPTLETTPVSLRGDVMDDPAFWHHPTDPAQSLILATDKRAGLKAYNLKGELVQQLDVGRLNNVDVRYQLPLRGRMQDLAVASSRDDNSLQLFALDAQGKLRDAGKVATGMTQIYGLCLYHSQRSGQHYVFVNDKSGLIEQYLIEPVAGGWQGVRLRSLQVPSQPEACVADDERALLYVGEEDAGIWRFAAEPDAAVSAELIAPADGDWLVPDIEGMALLPYQGRQYLVVSSQGNDSYVLLDVSAASSQQVPAQSTEARMAAPWVGRFRISTNPLLGIDGSSETDGLDLTTRSLGPAFPAGALVVQDGRNRMPEQGQNLKLVPLEQLLRLLPARQP